MAGLMKKSYSIGLIPGDGTGPEVTREAVKVLAADTRYYPMGTLIYVPGYGYGIVEDRGGDIKGRRRLDLFFNTHAEARRWGRRKLEAVVFPPGTPAVPKNAPPPR